MIAALYEGRVMHERTIGLQQRLVHGVYWWLIDVERPPVLPRILRPFARIESRDHLGDPAESIATNLDRYLSTRGIVREGRAFLLTNARVLGHVFNPLSVFYCLRADNSLQCVVAEVHNTYGERHCYLLEPGPDGRCEADKQFYVSPFLKVEGRYHMRFPLPDEKAAVAIELFQGGNRVFTATFGGRRLPLTARSLARLVVRYPYVTAKISLLIRVHGIAMWIRRLPVIRRPAHSPQKGVG